MPYLCLVPIARHLYHQDDWTSHVRWPSGTSQFGIIISLCLCSRPLCWPSVCNMGAIERFSLYRAKRLRYVCDGWTIDPPWEIAARRRMHRIVSVLSQQQPLPSHFFIPMHSFCNSAPQLTSVLKNYKQQSIQWFTMLCLLAAKNAIDTVVNVKIRCYERQHYLDDI